jgi:hypothetical protein
MTTLLSWDSNWKELDLASNLADNGGEDFVFLKLPPAGSSYEVHANSDSNTIYAGSDNLIDTDDGADLLLSLDGQNNILFGGNGPDTFVLNAPGDTVYGGLYRSAGEALPTDGFLNRFEVLLDGIKDAGSPVSIQDLQLDLDELFVDFNGTAEERDGSVSLGDYTALKEQLASNGVLLNAAPLRSDKALPSATGSTGNRFSYALPSGSFLDPDSLPLRYTATLSDGSDLPAWLRIDPDTGSLSGRPAKADSGNLSLLVFADDGISLVSQTLDLSIELTPDTTPTSDPTPTPTPPVSPPTVDITPVVQAPAPGSTVQTVDSDNDGLREVQTAPDGQAIDGNNDGIPDAQQANVAGFRLINDGASSADFGALEVGAGVQLQFNADPLITSAADGSFNFTGKDGAIVSAALPQGLSNRFAGVIAFEITNVPQGSSTDVTVTLPRTVTISDPNQSAYVRYNYATGRFEEFVDATGNSLYNLVDRSGDGVFDGIQLTLTDGDPQWDGDGVANGTVVDPGTLVEAQRDLIGNNKANRLVGNILANTLDGGAGKDMLIGDLRNDTLKGRADNDRLDGGEGADLIIGGGGRDRFIYRSVADSTIDQSDTIRKLSDKDRFDLRQFDAEVTFTFIGKDNFSASAGELRATRSSLQADLDGDGAADFRVNFSDKFRLAADQLLL